MRQKQDMRGEQMSPAQIALGGFNGTKKDLIKRLSASIFHQICASYARNWVMTV
jgi:hypothetical protein